MRILIVSQYFWPESFRINELATGLVARGHQVEVLTGLPNYPEGKIASGYHLGHREQLWEGVRIHRAPLIPRGKRLGAQLALNYASFALSACLSGLLRCRGKYDAIFVFQPSPITVGVPACLLSKLHKAPILFWVQDLWPMTLEATGAVKSSWILKQVDRLTRAIYRRCRFVLAQSEAFYPILQSQGVTMEQLRYIPNWVDDSFQPIMPAARKDIEHELPDGFRIMLGGNLASSQSLHTVLEAAAMTKRTHPQIRWILVGDGNCRSTLEAQLPSRGLSEHVFFLGRKPYAEMPKYFSAADALLVTLAKSPIFAATIPSKVQAYMACGRPILAALDGEGNRIVKAASCGLAVPAEDAQALADAAIDLYLSPPHRLQMMGNAARQHYQKNFAQTLVLDQIESLINDAASETNTSTKLTDSEKEYRCAA